MQLVIPPPTQCEQRHSIFSTGFFLFCSTTTTTTTTTTTSTTTTTTTVPRTVSGTTQVSQHQKGKTNLGLLEREIVSGSGISRTIYANLHLAPDT